MAEKREGFGEVPDRGHQPIKTVFQTPHYRVVVVKLTNGPPDQPEEMLIRYVVLSKEEPVVAGHSGLKGEAIGLALSAEEILTRAQQLAAEQAARNYKPRDEFTPGGSFNSSGGGMGAPDLG